MYKTNEPFSSKANIYRHTKDTITKPTITIEGSTIDNFN